MRAISPIVSAVILLMAALAAGAIIYQYFMNTIRTVADKPLFYTYDAQYLPELGVVYVNADNNGDYPVVVTNATIECVGGTTLTKAVNVTIPPGSSQVIRVDVGTTCTPEIMILKYMYKGRVFSTDVIRVS